eukprot:TRINITY_DN8464_c0_g1_i2.p1 TRINITY_DN8464_c0_g1~~TRINITY_DN8464_c0_g1_i2.p1  ORF type:complete len:131 (-),score=14.73 TRINITY_DN8464_c0_g1_i2:98-490(-)
MHMRIKTLDPKWKEQQERERAKFLTTNIAPDVDIGNTLHSFARRRTDIFGDVELGLGEEAGGSLRPARPDHVIWDGTAASVHPATVAAMGSAATRLIARQENPRGGGSKVVVQNSTPTSSMAPPAKRPRI